MPHSFDREGWHEALVMLWRPEGRQYWEFYTENRVDMDAVIVDGDMMTVKLPGPGIFAAYSHPD
eukprot:5843818-Prymnesium_polylepis.1